MPPSVRRSCSSCSRSHGWTRAVSSTPSSCSERCPPGVDRDALAADLQPELDAINPAGGHTLTFDEVGAALSGILRILAAARFRLPKELVLFFKNLLYLTGFTASVAPDADLLSQVEPVPAHFVRKYGAELAGALAAA